MTEAIHKLSSFPAFFKVAGRFAVVVGNGEEALAKCRLLGATQVTVCLIADEPSDALLAYVDSAGVELVPVTFDAKYLDGACLVFGATGDQAQDRAVVAAARLLKIPANAVDQPEHCDFFTPAIVSRAPVAGHVARQSGQDAQRAGERDRRHRHALLRAHAAGLAQTWREGNVRGQRGALNGHRHAQWHPGRRLFHDRGTRARPGLRPDERG